MKNKLYEFEAVIEPVPEKNGAFVRFPYDIKKELGVGRVKAEVTFDGLLYHGNIVNMGVKMPMVPFVILLGFVRTSGKR